MYFCKICKILNFDLMIDCLDCFGCRLFLRQRKGQEIKVTLLLMIPKCLPALVQKEVRLKLRKRITFENILYI